MWKFILFILAISPIIWLVISLSGMKMSGFKACPIALVISLAISLIVWKMPALDAVTAGLEGVALALWPILLVIIAAIFTYNLSIRTGNMDLIKRMLTGITADRRLLVLIIAWGFGGFLEGMAGFGTAVAIPASMLYALGFDPLFSAVVCLVANATPTAFGSIGIPTVTLGQVTGLDSTILASTTVFQLFPLIVLTPFLIVMLTGKSSKALKGVGLITLVSGLSFAIPEFLVAKYLGPELAAVVGSVCSMLCTIIGVKLKKGCDPKYQMTTETHGQACGELPPISPKRAIIAWLPFILIFLFLVLTSKLFPGFHNMLAAIKTSVPIYSGKGATSYTFTWVATPGVLIILATFIGGAVQGAKFKEMAGVLGTTVKQMTKTIITIVSVMATAKVMGYSGMISTVATMAVAVTGSFYPVIAPLIGSVGTFITGSATSSSVLFGKLQTEAASAISANQYWMAASNTCGACCGKIISPQSIAIAVAATGLDGKDGEILNKSIKYFIMFIIITGIIIYFGSPLAAYI